MGGAALDLTQVYKTALRKGGLANIPQDQVFGYCKFEIESHVPPIFRNVCEPAVLSIPHGKPGDAFAVNANIAIRRTDQPSDRTGQLHLPVSVDTSDPQNFAFANAKRYAAQTGMTGYAKIVHFEDRLARRGGTLIEGI